MAKKELSVTEKLRLLYDLQQIDSQIDEIRILKGELPMEVSDLEDEVAGLDTRVHKIETSIQTMENEIKSQQIHIKDCEAMISKYEKQLDKVKNNREFEALNKEIEMQKLEIQLYEKKIREFKSSREGKNEALAAATERKAAKEEALQKKLVELKEIISRTEKDEEKLIAVSEKQQKKIEDRLLKAYLKVRNTYRNGLAVVTVERNACGGCYNAIPPQLQMEIALTKKILVCEHCGRILVDKASIMAEEPAEA
ncbi:MAG: hypothetical protein KDC31_03105 [Saprospiraceae bacterium]|nr:hypothetical protein [Saprospiraceae bacterium]